MIESSEIVGQLLLEVGNNGPPIVVSQVSPESSHSKYKDLYVCIEMPIEKNW